MDIQTPPYRALRSRLLTVGLLALGWPMATVAAEAIGSQTVVPQAADLEFFEAKVRPLLVQHCAECHSRAAGDPEGGLSFDSRADFLAAEGVAVAGKPDDSLLVKVVRYISRLIAGLDAEPKLAFTKTKDSSDSPRFTVSMGVVPDYLYDGKGMRVDGVSEGKPAQAAGLMKGDIVIQLGDSTIKDMMGYMRALSVFKKGDSTQVVVQRAGQQLEKKVKF